MQNILFDLDGTLLPMNQEKFVTLSNGQGWMCRILKLSQLMRTVITASRM